MAARRARSPGLTPRRPGAAAPTHPDASAAGAAGDLPHNGASFSLVPRPALPTRQARGHAPKTMTRSPLKGAAPLLALLSGLAGAQTPAAAPDVPARLDAATAWQACLGQPDSERLGCFDAWARGQQALITAIEEKARSVESSPTRNEAPSAQAAAVRGEVAAALATTQPERAPGVSASGSVMQSFMAEAMIWKPALSRAEVTAASCVTTARQSPPLSTAAITAPSCPCARLSRLTILR